MKKITVDLSEKYQVYIGENEFASLPKLIADFKSVTKVFLAMESALKKKYLPLIQEALKATKLTISNLFFDTNNVEKNLGCVNSIIDNFNNNSVDSDTLVIVVGGEKFGHLVGFALSLLHDKPKYLLIPTTFSTMIDANLAGKYYLDTKAGKKQLTATFLPSMIYADTVFLEKLSQADEVEALAFISRVEILKAMGFLDAILQFDMSGMYIDLVCECIKIKYGYLLAEQKTKKINMLTLGEPYCTLARQELSSFVSENVCDFYGIYLLAKISAKAYAKATPIVELLEKVAEKYDIDLAVCETVDCSTKALREAFKTSGDIQFVLPYGIGNCTIEESSLSSPLMYTLKLAKRSKFDVKLVDTKHLKGEINIFNSVSYGHNLILISSFAATKSLVTKLVHNDDNQAVLNSLRALGFSLIVGDDWCEITQGDKFFDVLSQSGKKAVIIDVKDSESALSTMMCLCAMMGLRVCFKGNDKILTPRIKEQILYMRSLGVDFDKPTLPFVMKGLMSAPEYAVKNSTNEQMMIALLAGGFCSRGQFKIKINDDIKKSPAAIMIMELIRKMGGKVVVGDKSFNVDCSMIDILDDLNMNGDSSVSNLACWMTMKALGAKVAFSNTIKTISRTDKALLDFINNIGKPDEKSEMDASNCAELIPYIAVLNVALKRYYNIKVTGEEQVNIGMMGEIASAIRDLGGKCDFTRRQLTLYVGKLHEASISPFQDARIVMAMAALSIVIDGEITIQDAHCVAKSYPTFWSDFARLGAEYEIVNVDTK